MERQRESDRNRDRERVTKTEGKPELQKRVQPL